IKLMIQASPSLSNSSGVTQHAHSPLNLGQVSTWNHSRGLVVDANFETSGTPVYKLDRALGLDGGNGSIYIFGYHITTVEQAAGHSTDRRSISKEVKPDPVPPPKLWKTRNPCKPVDKDSPGDVLSSSRLTEEGVEGIITSPNGLVTGHLSIWLDPMLQA
ncbi:hypothetical protein Z043_126245, partial [Scleropages formosus]